MPIYLQDRQPLESTDYFNNLIEQGEDTQNIPWSSHFVNEPNSAWNLDDHTVFSLDDSANQPHTIVYTTKNPNDFRASYAYNESSGYAFKPTVSDLMVNFYAKCDNPGGMIGASLEKFGVLYTARVEFGGAFIFEKTVNGQTTPLRAPIRSGGIEVGMYEKFEFANVDQQLVLRWGDSRFTCDLSNDEGLVPSNSYHETSPAVRLFAIGPTRIRHISLYRDTFYLGEETGALRATDEIPFTLRDGEFFVCGDNSNNSLDSRLWSERGNGNNGHSFRPGIVPREYMMGKAVMVYWSQAYPPTDQMPSMVPNLNNLKVIFGGSQTEY